WYGGHIDGSFLSIIYPLLDCSGIPILTTLAEVWNVRSWHKADKLSGLKVCGERGAEASS
ncbi:MULTISPECIES: hypothetical protein, partial [Enterobacter cloacae complex]|nr:hypothetical protein [Enterobacter hormaechei]MCE1511760.1 hypothetical protein [Enterobacter hormaechei]MCU2334620.1 hypothetical protein [Enterobacter hormaechei subsp. steigerwaltii]